ncbi:vacuolar protein sorting-associated protein 41 [Aureococcus anophagefferens]|uniref:Vacuolar protein sorting-associated protein 41 n=1 Tax=Aureococcus anophagefferens TaxID=44056 RepID=A0ABR1G5U6_AURAN
MMKFSLHIAPGSSSGSQRAQPLPSSGRPIMSVLKQPLVPQRQRATPRRLVTNPVKGGRELAKSKDALHRVAVEIRTLRQRKQPANGTPAAQLDALMQSLYAKAGRLIDLLAADLFKSDDDLFKEFNNMDAIELAVLEVQEESVKVLRGEVSFAEAAQTTALASLASSRGASLPELVKEFERHVAVVVEDHRARAAYDQKIRDEGYMCTDPWGKRKHVSGDDVVARRERQKKYLADVASGERVKPKYDEEEHAESLIEKLERNRGYADSKRGLNAARIEESHDTATELPAGVDRRTGGRYAIACDIASRAGVDNTPSTDLAAVVARLEQARALAGVKERAPRTLPAGVAKCENGKFCTNFHYASGSVALRACGRIIYFETAEAAAAAMARFRAASAEEQKAMLSPQLKCCKCGQLFRPGKAKGKARLARLEDHEKTCAR